jgi:glycosyltransferase involved in cell wall biosynthesis
MQQQTALQEQMVQTGLDARCTGALPLPLLAKEMAQATVILLPQPLERKNEGGISLKNGTLAAAWGMGLPVIATRGDMTGNELQHGIHLHLVDDNETATWEAAIRLLLDDSAYRQRLAEGGHRFYLEHQSWEVVGRGFEEWLGLG